MTDQANRPSGDPPFVPPVGEEEKLLAELRLAGRLDPVPPDAIAAARACFMWRTLDAELAELTYDSVLDENALAGVRSTAPLRLLTFESPAMTVEIEANVTGSRRQLIGQLVPPQPGTVEIRHVGGSRVVTADELGRFSADDLAPGPVRLECRGAAGDQAPITTDWVLI